MNTNTENKLTVANLRGKGYKVDITHLRRTKGKRPRLAQKYEFANHDDINPKGGATVAKLVAPDGREAMGRVDVFHTDTYCKRKGITRALGKAVSALKALERAEKTVANLG